MLEFTIDMTAWGALLLAVGAIVVGLVGQAIGDVRLGFHWVVVAIVAFLGGIVASEFIVDWQAFAPVWEGLAIVPALIGGLIGGFVADAITRYALGGSYRGETPA
jgi:hypothetical protein